MSNERLKIGDDAINFSAQTWDDKTINLSDFKGKKVWLSFYRYASCPLCNMRIHEIIKSFDTFNSSNVVVLGIFQSPKEEMKKYVVNQKPPFDLISDPTESLYKTYRLESGIGAMLSPKNMITASKAMAHGFMPGATYGTITRIPADFLIDENGKIIDLFYGENIGDHIPFSRVNNFISKA